MYIREALMKHKIFVGNSIFQSISNGLVMEMDFPMENQGHSRVEKDNNRGGEGSGGR